MRALLYTALAINGILFLLILYCFGLSLLYLVDNQNLSASFDNAVKTLYSIWMLWSIFACVPLAVYAIYRMNSK